MHSGMFTIDHHRKWITGVTMGVVATDDITSGWWFGTCFFPTHWEASSQLTFMFQRGGSTTNQTFMLTCVYPFMVTIHSSYRLGVTIAPSTLDQASSVMQEAEPGSPFDGISTINRCGSLTYHPWYINMEMMWNLFTVDVDDPWYKEIGNDLKLYDHGCDMI